MQIENNKLIDELLEIVQQSLDAAYNFKQFRTDQLNYKPGYDQWSILECIEHLNLYGDYYLPEIEKQILAQQAPSGNHVFKSGMIGNYFANLMQVKNGVVSKKLKSPADKNPVNSTLTVKTIDRFIKQLDRIKSLLNDARKIDLVKTKTAISLTKFIKLRLGDTFRFYVYHIERHVVQAQRIELKLNRKVLV
jgi:hypothetical protein